MLGSVLMSGPSVRIQMFFRVRDASSLYSIQLQTLVMIFLGVLIGF